MAVSCSRLPLRAFTAVAGLTVVTMGCSNAALTYLNYPTQVRPQSHVANRADYFQVLQAAPRYGAPNLLSLLYPADPQLGGILIQRKRYSLENAIGAALMCAGLVVFTLADVAAKPEYNITGARSTTPTR